jgi:hypothetical protein
MFPTSHTDLQHARMIQQMDAPHFRQHRTYGCPKGIRTPHANIAIKIKFFQTLGHLHI